MCLARALEEVFTVQAHLALGLPVQDERSRRDHRKHTVNSRITVKGGYAALSSRIVQKVTQLPLTLWQGQGMKRAGFQPVYSMLTLGSFAVAVVAIFGCVWWACLNDSDQT